MTQSLMRQRLMTQMLIASNSQIPIKKAHQIHDGPILAWGEGIGWCGTNLQDVID